MTSGNVVFLFVLVAALGFFAFNAQRLVRYLRVAHDEDRTDAPWTRLRNVVVIAIGTVEILARGVFPAFGFERFLPAPIYGLFLLSQELFAALVLAAVAVL